MHVQYFIAFGIFVEVVHLALPWRANRNGAIAVCHQYLAGAQVIVTGGFHLGLFRELVLVDVLVQGARQRSTGFFELPEPVRLVCQETDFEKLLAMLSLHELDVVIADSPVPAGSSIRAFHHLLGECGITFFASPGLAARYGEGFPKSLDGAPMLLPLENTTLRRSLNQWFDGLGIRPHVVAELEDSALTKVFGSEGRGIFASPSAVRAEVEKMYDVQVIGETDKVRERFYAITRASVDRLDAAGRLRGDVDRLWLPILFMYLDLGTLLLDPYIERVLGKSGFDRELWRRRHRAYTDLIVRGTRPERPPR